MKSDTNDKDNSGKKYYITIEDKVIPWDKETITVSDIRRLGNIPADQSVVEDTPDGEERTLREDEIIHLKPGHRYGGAPRYHRG